MGPIGCPETSVRNCHYSLRNNPEELNSHTLLEKRRNHVFSVYSKDIFDARIDDIQ